MKNTQGGVRLRGWLRDERRTQEWLGEQIGTHQTNVSRWLLGKVTPPLEMALAIEKITGITPADWVVASDESGPSIDAEEDSLHDAGAA
jgi:transcriptional regulator with XRE-family HTH domain